jgi:hypothetical protein
MGTLTLCHTTQAIENDKSFQLEIFMHPKSSSQDFLEGGPANKGDKVHQFHWEEDSPQ